jgi:hypothetical protein
MSLNVGEGVGGRGADILGMQSKFTYRLTYRVEM